MYNLEELHFITLNYTSYYTLYLKLFKRTYCTINYDPCYTLHTDVKFAINLDRKVWHVKSLNGTSSQSFKNKEEITFYHPKLYS